MDSLANFIDEERDVLYIRGQRKGKQATEREIVTNMLTNSDLTAEQITNLTKVSTDFVLKLKAELSNKSK